MRVDRFLEIIYTQIRKEKIGRFLFLATFFFMLSLQVYAKSIFYFPERIISVDSQAWYEGHLSVMQESSLWQKYQDPKVYTYRYLLLSVLADPLCLRIDINDDKTARLVIIEMKRPSKYETQFQRKEIIVDLTSVQVEEFLKVFSEDDFWKATTKGNPIRFGGIQWVIEGAKDGQYHLIERWAPKEKDYPKAVAVLLKMVNYK